MSKKPQYDPEEIRYPEQRIVESPLVPEMEQSYIEYAMSVIVGRALPEHRKRAHPEREQEAAVFHGERVVRVIQKNGSLFVDFAEFFLPSGGVGQVRRASFSLHRQAVQEFCCL